MQETGHSYCITLIIIQSHEIMYVGVCKLWAHQIPPPPKKHTFVWPWVCSAAASCQITPTSWALWEGGRLVMTAEKHTLPRTWVLAIRAPRESESGAQRGGRSLCLLPSSHQITHQKNETKQKKKHQGSSLRRKSNTKWNCADQIRRRGFSLLIDLQVWAHLKAKWRHPACLCQFSSKLRWCPD